jgi:uncharacterized surface protein with fasciclin (FAS1) repeats
MKLLNIKSLFIAIVATFAIATTAHADDHGVKKDIVDVAAGNPDFSTLVAAIKAADLVDALKGDGPLTVF